MPTAVDAEVVIVTDPAARPENLRRDVVRAGVIAAGEAARWRRNRVLDDLDVVLVADRADAEQVATAVVGEPVVADVDLVDHLAAALDDLRARPVVDVVTGVSRLQARHRWGDHHFAVGVARAFHRRGWWPRIRCQEELEHVTHEDASLVVLLAGKVDLAPVVGTPTVAWVISHSDRLAEADTQALRSLERVFVASSGLAERLRAEGLPAVHLPQATDADRFAPSAGGPSHELLFVANSRGQRRRILDDLLPTDHKLAVYGRGWTPELLDPVHLVDDHVRNTELAAHYGAASLVLNDHWDDMRRDGLVSNRLFDAAAAGATVISDDVPGIAELFGDDVAVYRDRDHLRHLVSELLADPARRQRMADGARATVLAGHTFDHRVTTILAALPSLPASTSGPRPAGDRFVALADAPRPRRPASVAELIDEVAAASGERVASAGDAMTARYELERTRSRRPVRLVNALTAARRPNRKTIRRLRSAWEPRPVGEAPELPDVDRAVAEVRQRHRRLDTDQLRVPQVTHPSLRVAHAGAVRRFAAVADHTALHELTDAQLEAGAFDVALVEPGPGWEVDRGLEEQLARCREVGITTVMLTAADAGPVPDLDVDHHLVEGHDRADVPLGIAVDRFNPTGWRRIVPHPLVCAPTRVGTLGTADLDLLSPSPTVLDLGAVGGLPAHPAVEPITTSVALVRVLRRAGVLVDDVAWHDDPATAVRVRLAALSAGVPVVVVGDPDPQTAGLVTVADDLRAATAAAHRLLADPDVRERVSIVGRRAVLDRFGDDARFAALWTAIGRAALRRPRVSVVLSTNRPDHVTPALERVAAQTYPDLEVVLVLHGDGHDAEDPRSPRPDLPLTVVRAPAAWSLGTCLNAGIAEARGDLVAKMDDDDLYGPDHLTDLVLAQRYSHADVVGKRVEFVHLEHADVTIRRDETTPERFRTHVSGPSLLLTAEVARRVGFLDLPRRVDTTLCTRVIDAGGRVYRTHSRDLVLVRHDADHTWEVDSAELRAAAQAEVAGDGAAWASSATEAHVTSGNS